MEDTFCISYHHISTYVAQAIEIRWQSSDLSVLTTALPVHIATRYTGPYNVNLSIGDKVGIGVGLGLGAIIVIFAFILCVRKCRHGKPKRRERPDHVGAVSGELVKTDHHDDPIPYMGDIENPQSLLSELVPEQQRPRSLQELMSPNMNRLPKEHELLASIPTGELPGDYTAGELAVQRQTELPTPVSALYKESVSNSVLPEVSPSQVSK